MGNKYLEDKLPNWNLRSPSLNLVNPQQGGLIAGECPHGDSNLTKINIRKKICQGLEILARFQLVSVNDLSFRNNNNPIVKTSNCPIFFTSSGR
jgi:hypothetical protein